MADFIFLFSRNWNVRDCDPVIDLVEVWIPVLPSWILENIQDQLILPRLMQEVENWNPLTDTMPIHAWLHPWLPLMGKCDLKIFSFCKSFLKNNLAFFYCLSSITVLCHY